MWGFGRGSAIREITGYVSPWRWSPATRQNMTTNLYFTDSVAPQHMQFEVEQRFRQPIGMICIRPDLNDNPNAYIAIPKGMGYENKLRVGDRVTVRFSPEGKSMFCLGTVTELVAMEGQPCSLNDLPNNSSRLHWMDLSKLEKRRVGKTFLNRLKPNTRLLRLLGCLPGSGDGMIIVGSAGSGKSTFIKNISSEILEEDEEDGVPVEIFVIYIATERDEDALKLRDDMKHRRNFEIFASSEVTGPNQKLFIVEMGIQRAMRLAERGTWKKRVKVVVVYDSVTKGTMHSINGLPSPIAGLGAQKGGGSPLLESAITAVMGLRGNYGFASISHIQVVLDQRDPTTDSLINKEQGVSTVHVYLRPDLSFYPKINLVDYKEANAFYLASLARWQWDHDDPALAPGVALVRRQLNANNHLDKVKHKNPGERDPKILANYALEEAAQEFSKLQEMIAEDKSDAEILKYFGYTYVPTQKPAPQQAVFVPRPALKVHTAAQQSPRRQQPAPVPPRPALRLGGAVAAA